MDNQREKEQQYLRQKIYIDRYFVWAVVFIVCAGICLVGLIAYQSIMADVDTMTNVLMVKNLTSDNLEDW